MFFSLFDFILFLFVFIFILFLSSLDDCFVFLSVVVFFNLGGGGFLFRFLIYSCSTFIPLTLSFPSRLSILSSFCFPLNIPSISNSDNSIKFLFVDIFYVWIKTSNFSGSTFLSPATLTTIFHQIIFSLFGDVTFVRKVSGSPAFIRMSGEVVEKGKGIVNSRCSLVLFVSGAVEEKWKHSRWRVARKQLISSIIIK